MIVPVDRSFKNTNKDYVGLVKSIDVDNQQGICKILVYGIFSDQIPIDKLPNAYPIYDLSFNDTGSGRLIVPKIGSKVKVRFDGSIYEPRYFGVEEQDNSSTINSSSYENSKLLLQDDSQNLSISYNANDGIFIKHNDSYFVIKPDGSITLNHVNSTSTIQLKGNDIDINSNANVVISSTSQVTVNSNNVHVNGSTTDIGSNPIYSSVNGEPIFELLNLLATIIDAKYPSSPGTTTSIVGQMRNLILSNTVKTSP